MSTSPRRRTRTKVTLHDVLPAYFFVVTGINTLLAMGKADESARSGTEHRGVFNLMPCFVWGIGWLVAWGLHRKWKWAWGVALLSSGFLTLYWSGAAIIFYLGEPATLAGFLLLIAIFWAIPFVLLLRAKAYYFRPESDD